MKITLVNCHWGNVGLPGGIDLPPGKVAVLEVTEDERNHWASLNHVKIFDAPPAPPGEPVPAAGAPADNKGRLQQNDEVGATPGKRRAGRPGKVKP
jgi:hypothetical protein